MIVQCLVGNTLMDVTFRCFPFWLLRDCRHWFSSAEVHGFWSLKPRGQSPCCESSGVIWTAWISYFGCACLPSISLGGKICRISIHHLLVICCIDAEMPGRVCVISLIPRIKCYLRLCIFKSIFINLVVTLFLLLYLFIYIASPSKKNVWWLIYACRLWQHIDSEGENGRSVLLSMRLKGV